jgi:hypothetical protein
MKMNRRLRMLTAWLACAAWLLPTTRAQAVEPAPGTVIWDIRLDEHGALQGRLVDLTGQAVAGEPVELQQARRPVARATSDAAGRFTFPQIPAGVYQICFDSHAVTCRVWSAAAAPPAARHELVILAAPLAVRGQQPFHAVFRNPLFVGLVIAAAIAIPIAIHSAKDDRPPAS